LVGGRGRRMGGARRRRRVNCWTAHEVL
jgi:hypothetical protein